MKLKPAEPNTGVIFKRTDLKENNFVIPGVYNVSNAVFCTTVSNDYGVSISTIEHLMGALYGMGIDNILIEIDNEELPILDGSAKNFVNEINKIIKEELLNEAVEVEVIQDIEASIFDIIIEFKKAFQKSEWKTNRKINSIIRQMLKLEQQLSDETRELE